MHYQTTRVMLYEAGQNMTFVFGFKVSSVYFQISEIYWCRISPLRCIISFPRGSQTFKEQYKGQWYGTQQLQNKQQDSKRTDKCLNNLCLCMPAFVCLCVCMCKIVSMHMCMCTCVNMCVYNCMSALVCGYVCTCVCVFACVCVCAHSCVTVSMYLCACVHAHVSDCAGVLVCVCAHACVHAFVPMWLFPSSQHLTDEWLKPELPPIHHRKLFNKDLINPYPQPPHRSLVGDSVQWQASHHVTDSQAGHTHGHRKTHLTPLTRHRSTPKRQCMQITWKAQPFVFVQGV